jgi:hypothetical protein
VFQSKHSINLGRREYKADRDISTNNTRLGPSPERCTDFWRG